MAVSVSVIMFRESEHRPLGSALPPRTSASTLFVELLLSIALCH